jgi:hypothetical protein
MFMRGLFYSRGDLMMVIWSVGIDGSGMNGLDNWGWMSDDWCGLVDNGVESKLIRSI